MMKRTLLLAAVAATVSARRCWDDDRCKAGEYCNLYRPPTLPCMGLPVPAWGRCAGQENCCPDGFECRGRRRLSCKPIRGKCEPVEAKVCDGKTQCGGFAGTSCNSRSHTCIDNPDDNCDPAKGGADCIGCCVFDLCLQTECHKGDVCRLNAQGEPECVCEEGTEWKQDCNTCACRDGKAICTEIACETGCKDDADCGKEEFCKQDVGGNGVSPCLETKSCVKREVLGASCGGRTLPCFRKECQTGLRCHTDGTDLPGTCVEDVVVPPTCTVCGGIAGLTCPAGSVCKDDPRDNCDPAKGGADCSGCCEPVICCQAVPTCPAGFEETKEDACTKEMFENKQCVREALCCKEIVCKAVPKSTECKDDADCGKEEFCKQDVGGNGVSPCLETKSCVKREVLGASCGGRTLPCFRKECQTGLRCHTDGTDLPGTCVEDVVVPPTCTVCGGIAGLTCPAGSVCKDDPRDNCDPAKGGADCSGCCEPVICCQAVPTCPAGFEETKEDACTKQMWDSKICVREALCCKEIVCRTYVK